MGVLHRFQLTLMSGCECRKEETPDFSLILRGRARRALTQADDQMFKLLMLNHLLVCEALLPLLARLDLANALHLIYSFRYVGMISVGDRDNDFNDF